MGEERKGKKKSPLDVLIAQPFQNAHEREAFHTLAEELRKLIKSTRLKGPFLLVGNFDCLGVECDTAFFSPGGAVLIEFKSCGGRVRFREDAPWKVGSSKVKGGRRPNPLHQVQRNREALRELLSRVLGKEVGTLPGMVIFSGRIVLEEALPTHLSWFHIEDLTTAPRKLLELSLWSTKGDGEMSECALAPSELEAIADTLLAPTKKEAPKPPAPLLLDDQEEPPELAEEKPLPGLRKERVRFGTFRIPAQFDLPPFPFPKALFKGVEKFLQPLGVQITDRLARPGLELYRLSAAEEKGVLALHYSKKRITGMLLQGLPSLRGEIEKALRRPNPPLGPVKRVWDALLAAGLEILVCDERGKQGFLYVQTPHGAVRLETAWDRKGALTSLVATHAEGEEALRAVEEVIRGGVLPHTERGGG